MSEYDRRAAYTAREPMSEAERLAQNTSEPAANEFAGRSLAFVRMLKGLPGKYATAKDAYLAQTVEGRVAIERLDDPPTGAVVWYETSQWGNCALSLGNQRVLALNRLGVPVIVGTRINWLGGYLGWTETIR